MRQFGSGSVFIAARTIREVFLTTEKGESECGVVPVENSTDGAVTHTLDTLVDSELKICGEILLPISHHLLSRGTKGTITRVCSHHQALAQTRSWLAENLPNVEVMETSSTARAAEIAAGDLSVAAIATELAAEVYGVSILERKIEDNPHNYTRFWVVGHEMAKRTGNDKTALLFSVEHKAGSLHGALGILARNGINLTKIESRPFPRRMWEYLFFVDIEGHPDDEAVGSALADLRRQCTSVRVLGAWPV
jgi:chorismate mutase/prephenate dehydratase